MAKAKRTTSTPRRATAAKATKVASVEPIVDLWAAYSRARDARDEAENSLWRAQAIAARRYTPMPKSAADVIVARQNCETPKHPYPQQEIDLLDACRDVCIEDKNSYQQAFRRLRDWQIWRDACKAIDATHRIPQLEQAVDEAERAVDEAENRFLAEPTTSPLGVLLKLECIAAVDDLASRHKDEPKLILPRVILDLIGDLRAEVGRDA